MLSQAMSGREARLQTLCLSLRRNSTRSSAEKAMTLYIARGCLWWTRSAAPLCGFRRWMGGPSRCAAFLSWLMRLCIHLAQIDSMGTGSLLCCR